MKTMQEEVPEKPRSSASIYPALAPVLMMAFWMLLGGAAGIRAMQGLWRILGLGVGVVAIAVPVGGAVGALVGALLGLIRDPHSLVLLMAIFAGVSAGGVAGMVPWGNAGEIGGQVAGGLIGGIAWAVWSYKGQGKPPNFSVR